jgi:hypothetical protein
MVPSHRSIPLEANPTACHLPTREGQYAASELIDISCGKEGADLAAHGYIAQNLSAASIILLVSEWLSPQHPIIIMFQVNHKNANFRTFVE